MSLRVPVFYGSVRQERKGIRLARFLVAKLGERGHQPALVDPLELSLSMLDRMYKEYPDGEAPEAMEKIAQMLRQGDGFMIVSGEYNHSIPPALSNLLDHFLEEWRWRPSAIACYSAGGFGGVRAAMQLRAMLAELGASSIPSLYSVPKVHEAFDEQGRALDPKLEKRLGRFLDEFEWYMSAFKCQRAQGTPY